DEDFAALAASAPTATVTALTSTLTGTPSGDHPGIPVSFDTILPVLGRTAKAVEVAVPGGCPAYLPAEDVVVRGHGERPPLPTVEDIVAIGERFLGLRYLWAGVSAYGFDCSGYTYSLFHHHGITIHRDAGDQMHHCGLEPVEREDLQRGDLVFFATEPGGTSIRHVALHLGDDLTMQAPNGARSVELLSLTEDDPTGGYARARRRHPAGGPPQPLRPRPVQTARSGSSCRTRPAIRAPACCGARPAVITASRRRSSPSGSPTKATSCRYPSTQPDFDPHRTPSRSARAMTGIRCARSAPRARSSELAGSAGARPSAVTAARMVRARSAALVSLVAPSRSAAASPISRSTRVFRSPSARMVAATASRPTSSTTWSVASLLERSIMRRSRSRTATGCPSAGWVGSRWSP